MKYTDTAWCSGQQERSITSKTASLIKVDIRYLTHKWKDTVEWELIDVCWVKSWTLECVCVCVHLFKCVFSALLCGDWQCVCVCGDKLLMCSRLPWCGTDWWVSHWAELEGTVVRPQIWQTEKRSPEEKRKNCRSMWGAEVEVPVFLVVLVNAVEVVAALN